MKFFCGFFSKNQSGSVHPVPLRSQQIWDDPFSVYLCGNWKNRNILTYDQNGTKILIIGDIFEKEKRIQSIITDVCTNNVCDFTPLTRLSGNYNLIIQDKQNLYLFSDMASLSPIYYAVTDEFVIYSSNSLVIQQLLKAKLDDKWLASYLLCAGMTDFIHNSSPFLGVKCVPPCHFLLLSPDGIRLKKYYIVTEKEKGIGLAEAAELFRDSLCTSVQNRVQQCDQISSDLSGGLDSTTLSLIAADALAEKSLELTAITYESFDSSEREDVELAKYAANSRKNINHIIFNSSHIPLPYSHLEKAPLTDEPIGFLCVWEDTCYGLEFTASKGSVLHLSGEGGDPVLLASYSYLADLIQFRKLPLFFRHVYDWSRLKALSPYLWIQNSLALRLKSYQKWLRKKSIRLVKGIPCYSKEKSILGWSCSPGQADWYTQETRMIAGQQLMKYSIKAEPFLPSPGQHHSIVDIHFTGRISRITQQLGESYGVSIQFPYLDHSVIYTCMRTQVEDRMTPNEYKPLLKKAFCNELPHKILSRTTKGNYTYDMYYGMKINSPAVLEQLRYSLLADRGLIDLNKFRESIEKLGMGINIRLAELNFTLALEFWLRQIAKNPIQFWGKRLMNIRVPDHIYLSEVDGQMILLDTRKNVYYALNETGCELLKMLAKGIATTDAINQIAKIYEEDENTVKRDLEPFLNYLLSEGILERK